MSWGIEFTGSREGASKEVISSLDSIAATYKDQEEGKDVLAVKERLLALIAAADLTGPWNAVLVKANGSHSLYATGIASASFQASVTRVSLKL